MKFPGIALSLLTLSLIFNSCGSKKKVVESYDAGLAIHTLEKGACFGTCPVYTLTIFGDGKAEYKGLNNVDKMGTYTKTLSQAQLEELQNSVAEGGLDDLPSDIKTDMMDLPSKTIGYMSNGELRKITGKVDLPESFLKYMKLIEKIADSEGWTGIDVKESKVIKDYSIKDKIIVKLQKDTPFADFKNEFRDLNIELIRKLSPSLDIYLISYDTSKISGENFLKLINNSQRVVNAEFDKKVTNRRR